MVLKSKAKGQKKRYECRDGPKVAYNPQQPSSADLGVKSLQLIQCLPPEQQGFGEPDT